jgi:hypothetical protein
MEKKIIAIMVALVVVALVVVAAVTIGVGVGGRQAGGFTATFDKLTNSDVNDTYGQHLNLPDSWKAGDKKTVSDTIVDMWYDRTTVGQTHVYTTHLIFAYLGEKWNAPRHGTLFYVPQDILGHPWLGVSHGVFQIDVSSATNITAKYSVGDTITLTTMLSVNSNALLAFGEWQVADTI